MKNVTQIKDSLFFSHSAIAFASLGVVLTFVKRVMMFFTRIKSSTNTLMKTTHIPIMAVLVAVFLPFSGQAQVNSGSDGHDGAFNPMENVTIDMTDHPDGIYHYSSVNIPSGVTVTFKPNTKKTPVVWLVQGTCTIAGGACISVVGTEREFGGPGGFDGGNVGGDGQGPGGGKGSTSDSIRPGNASHATIGGKIIWQHEPGEVYGTGFCLPLIGGSGGGGGLRAGSGGGGGGAFLLVANDSIVMNGTINANGGDGTWWAGSGSGGAVRLISTHLLGSGIVNVSGGRILDGNYAAYAGDGRVRFDALDYLFSGTTYGQLTRGYQPVIFPPENQNVLLEIASLAGVAVRPIPTASLTNPDVTVPANQQNPIPTVVRCTNIPLNTEIIVDVKPSGGATVRAVGLNTSGTQSSSTATVQVNMPRGGGTIQAKAVSGLAIASASSANDRSLSLAQTGWTADGERFSRVEVTATLGSASQIAFLTDSGKRYALPIP